MAGVLKVNCEWDINQEGVVFLSNASAEAWVDAALVEQGFEETREELEGEGLVSYEWLEVIE